MSFLDSLIADFGKIIVFLSLLFTVFLFSRKSNAKKSNIIFGFFLLITSIDLSGLFLPPPESVFLRSLKVSTVLLQMPLYYFYVCSICFEQFKIKRLHLLHALPFAAILLYFSYTQLSELAYFHFELLSKFQYYAYIAATFSALWQFKKLYQANYSNNQHLSFRWLFQTTVLFLAGNTLVSLRGLVILQERADILKLLNLSISVFALLVMCRFVLKALHKPQLFVGVDSHLSNHAKLPTKFKPAIKDIQRIESFMISEKPFLDDQLTLQKLAHKLDLPDKELSLLINQNLHQHFFDFINGYRIQEAKALLTSKQELSVLEIVYQVGFNSKSSFYTAFKKETGVTPLVYRKSNTYT